MSDRAISSNEMTDNRARVTMAGLSDKGLRRSVNQDHIGFNQELGIAVLADGMGGHRAGEVAAQMAVETVLDELQKLMLQQIPGSITSSQLLEFLSHTISDSNRSIYQAAEADEDHKGMGTTLVAAVIEGSVLHVGHVGDSRLYLYREKTLTRITKDHSLVQDLIDKGFYTEDEARDANVGHVVTRALGSKHDIEVDTLQQELLEKDLLLMCSDGLTDMVPEWQIAEVIADHGNDLELVAKKLVSLANSYGGRDNISIILTQLNTESSGK